jgi:hypothetical protein
LSLRGFHINIQGSSDFDASEQYKTPTFVHPRILSQFNDHNTIAGYADGIICRELTIYNSTKNLLFLCYSQTLPNYSAYNQPKYNEYFTGNVTYNDKLLKKLREENNTLADNDEQMFMDFSHPGLLNYNKMKYDKKSINIFQNKFKLFNKSNIKILNKKYTNPNGVEPKKDVPQIEDLQNMLIDFSVRENIYNTIIERLSFIKYVDSNNTRWKLTMCSNKLLDTTTDDNPNIINALKVIFTKEDVDISTLNTCSDLFITEHADLFKNLDEVNFSNFINNINAGKITEGYLNSPSPFLSPYNDNMFISIENKNKIIKQHDTTDYESDIFDGAIYELIRYKYGCPNNWEDDSSKMTQPEINKCIEIANNINKNGHPIISDITQISTRAGLSNELCNANKKHCTERIKALAMYL